MTPTQLLTPPSEAYREATESLVYRLSELTFGSLLVVYLFGFINSIANHLPEQSTYGRFGIVLLSTQYVSISLTFASLTISFYLKYRTEILTMPQKPVDRPGIDLALAIAQGLTFGFSMFFPWSFPILLGVYFLLTGSRQNKEHSALAVELYAKICNAVGHSDAEEGFRNGLKEQLRKDFSELKGWAPTGRSVWWGSIAMITVGLASKYFVMTSFSWIYRQGWTTFEVVVLTVTITVMGYRVLRRHATFLDPIKNGNDHIEVSESSSHVPEDKPVSSQAAIKHPDAEQPKKVGNDLNDKPKTKKRPKIDVQFDCLQSRLRKLCTK